MNVTKKTPEEAFDDVALLPVLSDLQWDGRDASVSSRALAVLGSCLDPRSTITNLVRLSVAQLADWCAVFALENEQTIRRLAAVLKSDPADVDDLEKLYPMDLQAPVGPGLVLHTGKHEALAEITDELAESLGLKSDQFRFEDRKPCSYLCLPLSGRGRVIGAMAFVSFDAERLVNKADFATACDLARAAAVAIDNCTLAREKQEANTLKDEFVAMVSHELRTPLTPILGCIHLLRTAKLTEANFARALEMIEQNAQEQAQIVDDLLDIGRIVAGKALLVMKPVDVIQVVEAAVSSIRSQAEAKRIRIITNFDDVCQPIDGDPDRLRQIVWNLLANAVKFTPPCGRIEIAVSQQHNQVRIDVTDTGVGIPADSLPHIFDRFRHSNEGNKKTRSGPGLGLAIVRQLVELHHGSIDALSAGVGQGAVFTLKFPLQTRQAPPNAS